MPVYTYRREDGTTFEVRQKFSDDPFTTDPQTGQKVTRLVQATGVIFKGSGFYVNDSKGAKNPASPTNKTETKPETKSETKSEAPATTPSTPVSASAAD